jgi:hypothetical protein
MKTIYLIQFNMADDDRSPIWVPVRAYYTREAAEAHVEWMRGEYGAEIEYRVDLSELYE